MNSKLRVELRNTAYDPNYSMAGCSWGLWRFVSLLRHLDVSFVKARDVDVI